MEKIESRLGAIGNNSYGSIMEVIEYNNTTDILVKFLEYGNIVHCDWRAFRKGEVRNVYDKIIYGVGYIGFGKYKTSINRKNTPHYKTWISMLTRCYDEEYHKRFPAYKECSVSEEWHNFQVFAEWYDQNYYEVDGENMQLDKDIIHKGNKIYSPNNCIFVPQSINKLFTKSEAARGDYPIGVTYIKRDNVYTARCMGGKGKKRVHLGSFDDPKLAFQSYKFFKEKLIKQIAKEYKEKIPIKLYNALINYNVDIND